MTEEMDSCRKILSARAYLYLLFHKLYGGEPTEELMEVLGGSDTSEALGISPKRTRRSKNARAFLRDCVAIWQMMRGGNALSGYAVTSMSQSSTGFQRRLWFRLSLSIAPAITPCFRK